jgi:hypothetical protein
MADEPTNTSDSPTGSGSSSTSTSTPSSSPTHGSIYSRIPGKAQFKISKKQGIAAGGITGIFVSVIAFVIISGPLQIIHFAEMLRQYHYSDQSSNNTGEIKKLFNFARGVNPSRTRLGFVGNKIADRVTTKFANNGWEMNYDRTGKFTGYTYDPTKGKNALDPNSTPEQIKAHNDELARAMNSEGTTALVSDDGKKF